MPAASSDQRSFVTVDRLRMNLFRESQVAAASLLAHSCFLSHSFIRLRPFPPLLSGSSILFFFWIALIILFTLAPFSSSSTITSSTKSRQPPSPKSIRESSEAHTSPSPFYATPSTLHLASPVVVFCRGILASASPQRTHSFVARACESEPHESQPCRRLSCNRKSARARAPATVRARLEATTTMKFNPSAACRITTFPATTVVSLKRSAEARYQHHMHRPARENNQTDSLRLICNR